MWVARAVKVEVDRLLALGRNCSWELTLGRFGSDIQKTPGQLVKDSGPKPVDRLLVRVLIDVARCEVAWDPARRSEAAEVCRMGALPTRGLADLAHARLASRAERGKLL